MHKTYGEARDKKQRERIERETDIESEIKR